jgi:phosphonate transport system substrate-binding protein
MTTLRLTYYPDITQHRSPAAIRESVEFFSQTLAAELSRRSGSAHAIDVLPVMSVPQQTSAIADGACEIALIKPSSYVYAHRRNPAVVPAAVALRTINGKVGDTYFAQIYAHADLGVTTFAQLKAACRRPLLQRPSIGFGDPFSTSNFLVNAALLNDEGCNPFTRFRRMEFFGGHDGTVQAVYARKADVGAGHDGVIVDLARQPGFADAATRLIHIGKRDIHSDPVAVNIADAALRAHLEQSLLTIGTIPDIQNALDIFWGAVRGLGPTRHQNYASIEQSIDSLGLSESDVLGP